MSKGKRYTQEFKIEAVKQTNKRGYSVAEASERLGICTKKINGVLPFTIIKLNSSHSKTEKNAVPNSLCTPLRLRIFSKRLA